ncbi:hypothetical protein ACQUEF_13505 [Vagococcus fluvialis]|uniref:hypothetical protein n=1 Tax=Vagococcus fluvialis TaxID=2738 RepID=UPI003D12DEE0
MYYDEPSSSGGFSTIIGLVILVGIIYLLIKKVLPWINEKLDVNFKWWQIPLAIIVALFGLYAVIMKKEMATNREIKDRHDKYRKLSDSELEYLMYNGETEDEKRSAQIILQGRIKKRKEMWMK